MRLFTFLKNRGILLLRCALSIAAESLYVYAVNAGVLTGKLGFLQPLIVGTMPLAFQFVLLDIIFCFTKTKKTRDDKYLAVLILIAALLFCKFAVHAGWFVSEAVLISAVTVILAPAGQITFMVRWALLLIFLVLGLS